MRPGTDANQRSRLGPPQPPAVLISGFSSCSSSAVNAAVKNSLTAAGGNYLPEMPWAPAGNPFTSATFVSAPFDSIRYPTILRPFGPAR